MDEKRKSLLTWLCVVHQQERLYLKNIATPNISRFFEINTSIGDRGRTATSMALCPTKQNLIDTKRIHCKQILMEDNLDVGEVFKASTDDLV